MVCKDDVAGRMWKVFLIVLSNMLLAIVWEDPANFRTRNNDILPRRSNDVCRVGY